MLLHHQLIPEEMIAIDNDTYFDYMVNKTLNENDKLISSKDVYIKVNESKPNEAYKIVTQEEFLRESSPDYIPEIGIKAVIKQFSLKNSPIILYGYKPSDPIYVPDKWNWIKLRLDCFELETPIHNNKYRFGAYYQWKGVPSTIAFKDVFGIANDGNLTFDTSTFEGQSINFYIDAVYGELTEYNIDSSDCLDSISGVAFKHQLRCDSFGKVSPCGFISVLGNSSANSGSIGVTYAHSELTGSFSLSVNSRGPSISVSPSISFDTITSTAAIDFY